MGYTDTLTRGSSYRGYELSRVKLQYMYDGIQGKINFGSNEREIRVSEGSSYRESIVVLPVIINSNNIVSTILVRRISSLQNELTSKDLEMVLINSKYVCILSVTY